MKNCEAFENKYSERREKTIGKFPVVGFLRKRLPRQKWSYFVIEFAHCRFDPDTFACPELWLVKAASHLTTTPLYINPLFLESLRIRMTDFTADWEHYPNIAISGGTTKTVDHAFLQDWKSCYALLADVDKKHPQLWHSLQLYMALPVRLGHNELTTLGLFAVLESLLTHNPRGEEDTITRQICSKVALVEKRLDKPIDYSVFGAVTPDTVWRRLYDLRSRIAHGTPVRFEKQLQILDDAYTVERFLRHAVRSMLRGALKEPTLFLDLKAV